MFPFSNGCDNFTWARWVTEELCVPERLGITDEAEIMALKKKMVSLKERVDKTEVFYKTEWSRHVQSQADFACCCLDCEFHDLEGIWRLLCVPGMAS